MSDYKSHHIKCWPEPFAAIKEGIKRFEYRKNDREYNVGDVLVLEEYNPNTGYTGYYTRVKVLYVLYEGFGIPEGYCIMSIENI